MWAERLKALRRAHKAHFPSRLVLLGRASSRPTDEAGSGLHDLMREDLSRGFNEASFARAWSDISALGPLATEDLKLQALTVAHMAAGESWLIHRYLSYRRWRGGCTCSGR